jgi:Amidohydrolase family
VRILIEAGNAAVGVSNGYVVEPTGEFDVILRIPDGELRPGLINAHDHLHRNHYGRLGSPPYANAYEWGRDIHEREQDRIAVGRALPRRKALLRGAWKNLLAGVTTVVHHDEWEVDFERNFPIDVVPLRSVHSLGFRRESLPLEPCPSFAIHLAEGIDREAADEIRELDALGLLAARLLAVHVVGADSDGVQRFRQSGAAVVWCPTSNEYLFGRTAAAELLAPGTDVLIGSDSLLTGAGSLLDELRRARALGLLSDTRLVDAVGCVAARRLNIAPPSCEVGARANLVVLRTNLLNAGEDDVALVVSKGIIRVLDPVLTESLGALACAGELVPSGTTTRWILGDGYVPPSPSLLPRQRTEPASIRRKRL